MKLFRNRKTTITTTGSYADKKYSVLFTDGQTLVLTYSQLWGLIQDEAFCGEPSGIITYEEVEA